MTEEATITSIEKFINQKTSSNIFTDYEYEIIILNFLSSRGEEGASEEELILVVKECEKLAIGWNLLNMVFSNEITIGLKDGEVVYSANQYNKI